jgi:hypothetical protein
MWHPGMNSNMNFPSPLAFVGLAGAIIGSVVAAAIMMILFLAGHRKAARLIAVLTSGGGGIYIILLFGCSLISRPKVVARGQEKYFCEMDCHLAYSVVGVREAPSDSRGAKQYVVAVKTRFDETTISKHRPKDAPLMPSPREVRLIDSQGQAYAPESFAGVPLMQPLVPGESYISELSFTVPAQAQQLKLLLRTQPGFPDQLVIGNENSWLHKKTYLSL